MELRGYVAMQKLAWMALDTYGVKRSSLRSTAAEPSALSPSARPYSSIAINCALKRLFTFRTCSLVGDQGRVRRSQKGKERRPTSLSFYLQYIEPWEYQCGSDSERTARQLWRHSKLVDEKARI